MSVLHFAGIKRQPCNFKYGMKDERNFFIFLVEQYLRFNPTFWKLRNSLARSTNWFIRLVNQFGFPNVCSFLVKTNYIRLFPFVKSKFYFIYYFINQSLQTLPYSYI